MDQLERAGRVSATVDIRPLTTHLHATITGEYVDDDVKRVVASIMNAAHNQPVPKILIDCRDLTGNPSLRQRFELVAFVLQLRINGIIDGHRPRYRTAIVARPPLAHPNRYGIRLLVERRLNVTICERLEEALAWLEIESDGLASRAAGG
jgi:hypothetical protein